MQKMTFYLFILRRKKAQKHMDSMLWEQEAASSSLATPIKKRENQRTEQAAVAHCQEMWGVSSHLILSQKEAAVVTQRPLFTIMSK